MTIKNGAEYFTLKEIENLEPRFVNRHYEDLKEHINQIYGEYIPRLCLICGEVFGRFDLHHGIVSRQDIRGWRFECGPYDYKTVKRLLIDTELNVVPLHHQCHLEGPPTRQECWDHKCEYYGEEVIKEWYTSLPWKQGYPPRRFW